MTMDRVRPEVRSRIMSNIRRSDTRPELEMKKMLRGLYLRYHPQLSGNPDFACKTKKIAIFVDGCFWHKCPSCFRPPKSHKRYWGSKINGNIKRDRKINAQYRKNGWKVIRVWEHQLCNNRDIIVKMILREIENSSI